MAPLDNFHRKSNLKFKIYSPIATVARKLKNYGHPRSNPKYPALHPITTFGHVSYVCGVISPFMRHGRKFGVKIDDFGLKKDPSLLRNHGNPDPKVMFFCNTLI